MCSTEEKFHLVAFFLICCCAVGLRLYFLLQPMRCDESFTFVQYASQPLSIGLADYSFPNNHLFHTLLVHLVYQLFGNQVWAIRLPAFVAGILTVPAAYLFARRFYDKEVALLTAALVATSSALIEYSTNARGYTLICLFFLILLSLATALKNKTNYALWLVFALLSAVGFYTIPVMLYPFGVATSWVLMSILSEPSPLRRTTQLKNLALSCVVAGVLVVGLYTPVFATSGWRAVVDNPFVMPRPFAEFVVQFPDSLRTTWTLWNRDMPTPLSLLLGSGFIVSLILHRHISNVRIPVVVAAVMWLVPLLLIQRVVPWARVWLFLLPVYLTSCAAGLVALSRMIVVEQGKRAAKVFAVAALMCTVGLGANVITLQSIFTSTETGTLPDAEAITQLLMSELQEGDRLVAESPSVETLQYYFLRYGMSAQSFFADVNSSQRVLVVVNKTVPQDLDVLLANASVPRWVFGTPIIVREFGSATVYGLVRNEAAAERKG